jgi:hypothetical protein
MLLTHYNGYADFTVVDDSTGKDITEDFLWVDDTALEMRVISHPVRHMFGEPVSELVAVTAVRVDYACKVIHVNEPPVPLAITVRELRACGECCQSDTCSRINYCAAFKTCFGEASPP